MPSSSVTLNNDDYIETPSPEQWRALGAPHKEVRGHKGLAPLIAKLIKIKPMPSYVKIYYNSEPKGFISPNA